MSKKTLKVRSVFISDVHLGFRGCQAEALLHFLHSVETEYLFLVGDIVDFWALGRSSHWPQTHTNVIRSILGKAKHQTRVIYIPGNHDDAMRDWVGHRFGNVEIHRDFIHTTADNKKLLVMHGDEFDLIVKHSRFLAGLGSVAYDFLLTLNHYVNRVRRKFNRSYWSLAAYLKHKVKNAVDYIGNFEKALAHEARERGVDGVVCGHIHHAEVRQIEDILYCNDGDWVESCSSLLEHPDGRLELVFWANEFAKSTTVELQAYAEAQARSKAQTATAAPLRKTAQK